MIINKEVSSITNTEFTYIPKYKEAKLYELKDYQIVALGLNYGIQLEKGSILYKLAKAICQNTLYLNMAYYGTLYYLINNSQSHNSNETM